MIKSIYACDGCGKEAPSLPVSISIYGTTPTVSGHACNEACLQQALLKQAKSTDLLTTTALEAKRDKLTKDRAELAQKETDLSKLAKELTGATEKLEQELETILTVRALMTAVLRRLLG